MDDLIGEFITETSESLAVIDTELVRLEQEPNSPELISSIFRLVHTIKGTCGFLGLPRLESVAHSGENVLGKIRDGELTATPEAVSLVLESMDCIKDLVAHLEENGEEPAGDDSDLISRLDAFAEGAGKAEATDEAKEESDAAASENGTGEAPYEGGLSRDVLDELERAFQEAAGPDDEEEADAGQALVEVPEDKAAALPDAPPVESSSGAEAEAKQQAVAEGAKAARKEGSGMSQQSLRVNLNVLEHLMQMVSELVLTRNQLLQILRSCQESEFATPLQRLSHITTELQEGVMQTRMQPIGNAWSKFPRIIRDLSLELGKKIELKMEGAETELDRQLLDMIKDPLTHMVRNSCDHGLETTADRKQAGKPETGTVVLRAYHEGGHIIVEIQDDGKGINVARVREKAIQNGLTTEAEAAALTDKQIIQFIFQPGFSTAEQVTAVSGRGVGMDVVRTNIEKIGGTIDLDSEAGKGSIFRIKIPLTLAIVSVLIVETCGEKFAIPQINIEEMVRVKPGSEHRIEHLKDTPVLRLRERLLPLLSLSGILRLQSDDEEADNFIVVCKVGTFEFGLIVNRVFDTEEIVVKPVAPILKGIEVYSGSTILGDGNVIMILDLNGVVKQIGSAQLQGDEKSVGEEGLLSQDNNHISFLLFDDGGQSPKAVPLELVSRLEEFDRSMVEYSGGFPVVQYRSDLMRLKPVNENYDFMQEEMVQVIVFQQEDRVAGLVVKDIIDIVKTELSVKPATEKGLVGSMVMQNKTTDIIDVGHHIQQIFGGLATLISDDDMPVNKKGHRLLLAEDSLFFRNLLVPLLTISGYDVTTAENGQLAWEILQKDQNFDIIVTDIDMPKMTGFDLAEACETHAGTAQIPRLAFTANTKTEALKKGEKLFRRYVTKTDHQLLLEAIRTELSNQNQDIEEAA